MNQELKHMQNPSHIKKYWAVLYGFIILAAIFGMYVLAANIKTRVAPVGQIELTVPYSKYLLGESISYSIKNKFNSPIRLPNNCPAEPMAVYRFESDKWQRIHDTTSKTECAGEDRRVIVPANGLVSSTLDAWPHLFDKVGKYRLVAFVDGYNDIPYQQFEIVNPIVTKVKPTSNNSNNNLSGESSKNYSSNSNSYSDDGTEDIPSTPTTTSKKSKTVSVNGAGSISVQYDNSNVYVTSIAPASGCAYEGGRSGTQVEVTFKCGGNETQIQLQVVGGVLQSKVEKESGD